MKNNSHHIVLVRGHRAVASLNTALKITCKHVYWFYSVSQANDNDQQGSENSHVIYRIANCKPNVCSNFALAGNSGLLAVNSPLDYENLVGVEGVITITVWAIDNGSPQLTGNTTVQITVEVSVSIGVGFFTGECTFNFIVQICQ